MRMYGELAPWFHLLTHPDDYADEAAFAIRALEATAEGPVATLLELGSGGGNNASHLKHRFTCTLTDLSGEMLASSRSLNPECEHVQGDMRTLRLGREFDAVFVHDALAYLTTEEDLGAALETAAAHCRRGGAVLLVPDEVRETFRPSTDHGGHDGDDGRALRYLEWVSDPDPDDTTYDADYLIAVQGPGQPLRVVHDHHVCGVFPRATWERLLTGAGFELAADVEDPYAGEHTVFAARRR